ncbi:MAG: Alginate export, partial [Pseudomonadota bacterium]
WGPAKGLHTVGNNLTSPTYSRDNATEATFGARAKQKIKIFDYRTELGVQAGSRPRSAPLATATAPVPSVENVNVLAYQADLELGVSFLEDKYRVSVEGLYASGDKANTKNKSEGWDELFPTGHKFLGLSDAFAQGGQKRTNVASGVLHLTAVALKQLTFQIDGHVFARPEKNAQFFNEKGFAGGELDVGAVLLLAKGLKLRGTYAVFVPNSELYHDVLPSQAVSKSADPVHWAELELRYDLMP